MSPCGDDGLDIHWSFDDGGAAFGKTVNHAWADNFLGNPSPPHTGQVVITDPTGLKTTLNFSVPVANVPPTVDGGPNKTQLWGVPVSFHGNGTDQGSVDDAILTYLWGFGDPNSPLGAAGQDVSHVYSMPGSYVAEVTVTDQDGAQGTDSVNVSVLKRGTTISYTGPLSSNPSKDVTMTASLVDELNQPVSGRTVVFTLGSQTISAATNASGVATATIKLNQKQGAYTVSAAFTEAAGTWRARIATRSRSDPSRGLQNDAEGGHGLPSASSAREARSSAPPSSTRAGQQSARRRKEALGR